MEVVNASGHPIEDKRFKVVKIIPPPHINPAWIEGIMDVAREMAKTAAPYVKKGAAVALPGLSYLAAAFIVALYMETGNFPVVVWSVKPDDKSGYVWSPAFALDLEQLKEVES